MFQHTAARRRLAIALMRTFLPPLVSTHSRPKAAGDEICRHLHEGQRFNTQPPEGGWWDYCENNPKSGMFQHTAARRRLGFYK